MHLSRSALQALSRERLREARLLATAGHWPGAYYLSGYAVECALKACIVKKQRRHEVPFDRAAATRVYSHDLVALLRLADVPEPDPPTETCQRGRRKEGGARMASSELVDADIRAGRDVIATLVAAGVPLRAASWFHAPEFEDWRLMLSTPLVRTQGPLAAYRRVTRILSRHESTEDFPLSQLWLVDDKDPRSDALSKFMRTTSGAEVRLRNRQIHDCFVPDALIYGLPRSA